MGPPAGRKVSGLESDVLGARAAAAVVVVRGGVMTLSRWRPEAPNPREFSRLQRGGPQQNARQQQDGRPAGGARCPGT
ncbi:hypothetical protein EYF80_066286 [Liparis tanakae]|uniref:Uncharacterized protein n=1 Tax=Liparis tanakae TaxID=230148 RepID=A0A4Z2E5H1_9TELE|nr:hypothetical protein EYF80_066286 [Liparis tanakae]